MIINNNDIGKLNKLRIRRISWKNIKNVWRIFIKKGNKCKRSEKGRSKRKGE
jgi:hypothetical protein